MATEPRSTTAPCVDGELMPQRQVLEDEISAGADRCEECCDKQTEVEHRRASRGSPILCYLSIEPHGSSFALPRQLLGRADGNGKEPMIHDAIADLGAQVCEIKDELHEFQIEVRRLL